MLDNLPANSSIWKLDKERLSWKVWIGAHIDNKKLKAVFLLNLNFEKLPRMHFQFYAVCECQICLAGTEFLESNYCCPIWLNIPINIPEVYKTRKCWYRLNSLGRWGYLRTEFFCHASSMSSIANMYILSGKNLIKWFIQNQLFQKKKQNLGMRCLNPLTALKDQRIWRTFFRAGSLCSISGQISKQNRRPGKLWWQD